MNTRELASARVKKQQDGRKVSPVDLLLALVDDIEKGKVKIKGVVCVYLIENPNEKDEFHVGCDSAGFSSLEEIGVLSIALQDGIIAT